MKSKVLKGILSAVLLVAMLAAVMYIVENRNNLSAASVWQDITSLFEKKEVQQIHIDTGGAVLMGETEEGIAAVSESGIKFFLKNGEMTLSETMRFEKPALKCAGKYAMAYDISGTVIRVFESSGISCSLNLEQPVTAAKINEKGYMAVAAREEGYKGAVTVYDRHGKAVYKWYSGEGYIVNTAISPDASSLAVLTASPDGSHIYFLNLNSEETVAEYFTADEFIIDIEYFGTNIMAISDKSLMIVSKSGLENTSSFGSAEPEFYSMNADGFAVVCLQEAGNERIVSIDGKAHPISELSDIDIPISISVSQKNIGVLYRDKMCVYDSSFSIQNEKENTAGAKKMLVLKDSSALLISAYSAVLIYS